MTHWISELQIDGISPRRYAGDTLKYLFTVLDEDRLPFAGTINAAHCEIMQIVDGVPTPFTSPLVKTLAGGGITKLTGTNVLEVIFLPVDTATLLERTYLVVMKVYSTDFGEVTHARRLLLERELVSITP